MRTALAVLITSLAGPTLAGDFSLAFPVDCTLGTDCFIEDYVDRDPTRDSAQDFTCGLNTRDGHRGTDIALLSFDAVDQGVSVRAAAAGTVLRIRDSMPDDRLMPGVTDQNACGNAVLVDHGNGYETLYCHLRMGSVAVAPGDVVTAGTQLGLIGLSGRTTHPHLHLTLRKDGQVIDPFHPDPDAACGTAQTTLWEDPSPYDAALIRLAGFSDAVPGYDALRAGTARRDTAPTDSALVLYAELGFAQDGDSLTLTVTGPNGAVIFTDTRRMTDPRVSQLPAYGRRAPAAGWPAGEYLGQLTLRRAGRVIANRFAHITITN